MRTAWLGFGSATAVALIALGAQRSGDPGSPDARTPGRTGLQVARAEPGAVLPRQLEGSTPEATAIREVVGAFVKAYNAKDAGTIASQFAEDGRIVGPDGSITEGRPAIERRYREAFESDPDAKIEVTSESVRLLAPDVVLEEGRAAIRSGDTTTKAGRYHALYVRRNGRWLQSSIYDFSDEPAKLTPADRLKDLEWLLGDWIDERDEAVVQTSCHWDSTRAYLIRDFELRLAGRAALSGTQRIGWDPSTEQFRSWVFDSEGGFSEGRWTRDGERWVIKNDGVVPDGRVVTATNSILREGKDRIHWSTTDRTLGGQAIEDDAEVILVRKPPKAQ
jgi:uncharacterized protein (TIGR02246 family)